MPVMTGTDDDGKFFSVNFLHLIAHDRNDAMPL
jgi:hypothetical protein